MNPLNLVTVDNRLPMQILQSAFPSFDYIRLSPSRNRLVNSNEVLSFSMNQYETGFIIANIYRYA